MKMSKEYKYHAQELEKRAETGDYDAMMDYVQMYNDQFPEEVTDDIDQKMVEYYEACIEAGNLMAALNLGAMYYGGEFIPQDFAHTPPFKNKTIDFQYKIYYNFYSEAI